MVQKEPLFVVLCLALAACAAEFRACIEVMSPPDLRMALLIHTTTITVLALWTLYVSMEHDYRFSLLLLVATAVLGPYGALLGLLALVVYAPDKDSSEWLEHFFAPQNASESDRIQERLASGLSRPPPMSTEPYEDILEHGTILQKQMAIAKMTRYFHPQFAPLLLKAARNPEAAVRVQAATALAKIERDFMSEHMRVEAQIKKLPNDQKSKIELAQLYDDYAFAGTTDEATRHLLRDQAIHIYEAYVENNRDQIAMLRLARLYLRQGHPEKATELLAPLVLSKKKFVEASPWYMEALFRQRRLKELRQFVDSQPIIRGTATRSDPFKKVNEILKIWDTGSPLGFDWGR